MKFKYAENLSNGDQVRDKETGEIVTVLRVWEPTTAPPRTIVIEGVGERQGYKEWIHTEIE